MTSNRPNKAKFPGEVRAVLESAPASIKPQGAERDILTCAATTSTSSKPAPPRFWLWLFPALWIAGMLICLGQYAISLAILSRTARRGTRLDPSPYQAVAERAGVRRVWTLLRDPSLRPAGPRTWGVIRPVVSLPESSLAWPREPLEAVVLHELAHVRRLDSLSQAIIAIACGLNWFNPLVWFCAKQARKEAEQAADDAVLSAGVRPSVYAEALVQAAMESKSASGRFLFAGVPFMKQSKIEARVRAILSPRGQARRIGPIGIATTAIAALMLTAPCATLSAKAAPFEEPAEPILQAAQPPSKPNDLQKQVASLKAQLMAQQAQMARMRKQMAETFLRESKVRAQENEIRAFEERTRTHEAEIRALEEKDRAHEREIQRRQGRVQANEAEKQALDGEIQARRAEMEAQNRSQQDLGKQLDIMKLQADVAARQARKRAAESERAAAKSAAVNRRPRNNMGDEQRALRRQQIAGLRNQIEQAMDGLVRQRELKKQGAGSQEALDAATAAVDQLRAAIGEVQAKLKAAGKG